MPALSLFCFEIIERMELKIGSLGQSREISRNYSTRRSIRGVGITKLGATMNPLGNCCRSVRWLRSGGRRWSTWVIPAAVISFRRELVCFLSRQLTHELLVLLTTGCDRFGHIKSPGPHIQATIGIQDTIIRLRTIVYILYRYKNVSNF